MITRAVEILKKNTFGLGNLHDRFLESLEGRKNKNRNKISKAKNINERVENPIITDFQIDNIEQSLNLLLGPKNLFLPNKISIRDF